MADPIRVLIVDDDDDVRETLGMVLEAEGFEVVLASNGEVALDALLSGRFGAARPRVMLLDLRMPVLDGWQVLDALRHRPEQADLPIVICTSSPRDAPEGLPLVSKPVELDPLVTLLRRVAA